MTIIGDSPPADKPAGTDGHVQTVWTLHAPALAAWADKHIVNRRDAFGGYYRKDGATHQTTRKEVLTPALLTRHFVGRTTEDIIGLHSTFRDERGECWCRWGAVDIDAHPGQNADPDANLRFALALYELALRLGFRPLLYDSNGKGGYHLVLLFERPVSSRLVFVFLQWLIRDWESHGFTKPPETFPKQPEIRESGFGNWLRLPGRHHTRDHSTRVWTGSEWAEGSDAIKAIVSTRGAPESAIPAEARPDPNAPFDLGREIDRKRAQGDGIGSGKGKRPKPDDGTTDAGADFNVRASWESILTPHGWRLDHESEGTGFWTRPGKAAGTSATTGHSDYDTLFVFTDGTTFHQNGSYSKFGAHAVLNHGGDLKEACKALSLEGYGTFATWVKVGGEWVKEIRPNPCPKGLKIAKPGDRPPGEVAGPEPSANGTGGGAHEGNTKATATAAPAPKFPLTDLGNGERLVHQHGPDLRYVHPWCKWLAWDRRRFCLDNTAAVVRRAKRTVRTIYREAADTAADEDRKDTAKWAKASEAKSRIEAMLWSAAREHGVPVLPDDLDTDPWFLNCLNGTVDLRTGELREHRREDLITKLCPVEFDIRAECPLWRATLQRVFAGNLDLIGFWRRLCGVVMTGTATEQMLPILHGSGANGKSTLLNTLLDMLGPDYGMKAPPSLLTVKRTEAHPTEQAALFGKRLVVAIETGEGARINEVMVKELTGSDPITARRMREDYWTFKPTHKVMLCTNHKPSVRGTDHAIWRRLRLIPFTVTIPDNEQDKALPEKLRAEYPGILAWCVLGCLEWQEDGLKPPAEVTKATAKYREDEDLIGAFLTEHCMVNEALRVKATPLYNRYRAWAEASGENPVNQRKFGEAMTERGFERVTNNGTQYEGIGLRPDDAVTY